MSAPTVSVILPTYNREETIARSIESVLDQTYEDFELIVVDGGSTDRTEAVVSALGDERLRFVRQTDDGPSEARNEGIRRADGQFVAFQDSDDVWKPRKLETQIDRFRSAGPEVGVVYTAFRREFPDGTTQYVPSDVGATSGWLQEQLLTLNVVTTSSAVVRSECFDAVGGFDERLPAMEDWELWIRLSKRYAFEFVDEPLVRMETLEDSLSRNTRAVAEGLELVLSKHHDAFHRNDPRRLAELYWRLSELAVRCGDVVTASRALGRSLALRARNPLD